MGEECGGECDARGTRAAFHSVRLEPFDAAKPRKVVILTTDYVRRARCEDEWHGEYTVIRRGCVCYAG